MLEADALDRVGELDVDAEIVGIELEAIVGREPGIFLYVHRQRRDRPVEGELPVFVAFRGGVERHPRLECVGADCHLEAQRTRGPEECQGKILRVCLIVSALYYLSAVDSHQSTVSRSHSLQSKSVSRLEPSTQTVDCRLSTLTTRLTTAAVDVLVVETPANLRLKPADGVGLCSPQRLPFGLRQNDGQRACRDGASLREVHRIE